jgi:hypothetical protein
MNYLRLDSTPALCRPLSWRSPNHWASTSARCLMSDGTTFLDPIVKPLERLTYKLTLVDPNKEQDWMAYAVSPCCIFSLVTSALHLRHPASPGMCYPFSVIAQPAEAPRTLSGDLAFNTAASFTTNTNWQSYGGESTMSYFSQMVALTIHNFFSAAVGLCDCRRAGARHRPPHREDDRQLLGRSDTFHLLPAPADLHRLCYCSRLPRDDPELQTVCLGDSERPLYHSGARWWIR